MIPEGLVLLTSVAFAVGVIRLGARNMPRPGAARHRRPRPHRRAVPRQDRDAHRRRHGRRRDPADQRHRRHPRSPTRSPPWPPPTTAPTRPCRPSPTTCARSEVGDPNWRVIDVMPFSSARKWSGTRFTDNGTWLLGAPDILLDAGDPVALEADMLAAQGLRVLALVTAESASTTGGVSGVKAQALVVLRQRLRSTTAAAPSPTSRSRASRSRSSPATPPPRSARSPRSSASTARPTRWTRGGCPRTRRNSPTCSSGPRSSGG